MLSRAGRVARKALISRNRCSRNKLVKKEVEEDETIGDNNTKSTEQD